jgi:16S rRNA (guanine527-N7)-methyltransferase
MFYHSGRHILVEPRQKRTIFLTYVLGALELPGVEVRRCRAEDLPDDLLRADVILSKAFMPWREYLEVARPLLAEDGLCLVLSSEKPPEEPPGGWRAGRSVEYEVAGRYRSVWSFTPAICSRKDPL